MIPGWLLLVVIGLAFIAVVATWLSSLASRLNRLHMRTDAARLNLEGALRARGAVISVLHPELQSAATRASGVALRAEEMGSRSDAENLLLRDLDMNDLSNSAFVEASTRVDLAARFYNDAVSDTLALRVRPSVRLWKLAGSAPLPAYYEAMSAGDGSE